MQKNSKKRKKTRKNTIFGWNTKMHENPRFSPFDFGPKKCKKCSLIAPLVTCRGPEGGCTKVIFALAPASGRRGRAVWRVSIWLVGVDDFSKGGGRGGESVGSIDLWRWRVDVFSEGGAPPPVFGGV